MSLVWLAQTTLEGRLNPSGFQKVAPDQGGQVRISVGELGPQEVQFYRFLNSGNQEVRFFVGRDSAGHVQVAFDANAANAALDAAATQASSCRKGADPSGVAVVTVTFSPAGRVTTANLSGPPFAGTETGSCIATTLRSAQVPAFAGEFMTVKKTVTIR